MPWNYQVASDRIDALIRSRPQITTEALSNVYPRLVEARVTAGMLRPTAREALLSIPRDRAIVVDGVHLYARLSNYDDYRLDDGAETEASHKRALNFLHLHYAAVDRIIEDFGAQRVDFHGGRMHCVVVDPMGDERQRVIKALMLAHRLIEFTQIANREIAGGNYTPRLKVGLDSGPCVVINSGSGCEQEPLFLGAPANYAAKLADGDGQGVFPSNRIRRALGLGTYVTLEEERSFSVSRGSFEALRAEAIAGGYDIPDGLLNEARQYDRLVTSWRQDLHEHRASTGGQSAFRFHVHTPPLHTIDYAQLSPGNSIRMPLASIFADLDGYTSFIDSSRASGNVEEAVRALHVIRGEFHNVLKQDFRSRKVRYIGDCVHGLLAFGTAQSVDLQRTTREAVLCAAALQGSFELIQEKLGGLGRLGLAVGIEVGETPVSRIGIRGDRSVRVASSTATIQSQIEQENIVGSGLALGPVAYSHLSLSDRRHFPERRQVEPDYDTLAYALAGAPFLAAAKADVRSEAPEPEFRPHSSV